jgi:20S proteasome subunit beta 2
LAIFLTPKVLSFRFSPVPFLRRRRTRDAMDARPDRPDLSFPHLPSGFSFENHTRNATQFNSSSNRIKLPNATKTGTTIVGVVFSGGVVLGADTRATSNLVVDKNCSKIHYMAPNIYCCGAGTAADTEATTLQISSQLELLRLNAGTSSRVATAMTLLKRHLYQYQGHVSAALVLGGCDSTGAHLYTVAPHGSTDKLPFVTMGSGSLAAMSVFETQYKDDMTEAEAKRMVADAIRAGIFNDLGSGSNVDVCVIRHDQTVEYVRGFETPNEQSELRAAINLPKTVFNFPQGTTIVTKEEVRSLVEDERVETF